MRHDNSPLRLLRITIRSPRAALGAVTVVTAVTTLSFSVSSTFGSGASEVSDVSYAEETVPGAAGEIGTSITIEEVDPGTVPAPTTSVPVPTSAAPSAAAPTTTDRSAPVAVEDADATGSNDDEADGETGDQAAVDEENGDEAAVDAETGDEGGTGSDDDEDASPAGQPAAASSGSSSYRPPTAPAPAAGPATSGAWLSGGTEVDGSFDSWRGAGVDSASHWADSQEACENQWGLTGQFADWTGPLVVAIGGLWDKSWSEAANGGMDAVWTTCLNALKSGWGSRPPSNLVISLFHEANGTWYEWSVSEGDVENFKAAFARFEDLQEQIFPGARLSFVLNADHVQGGYEPADMLPDPADYDVLGVDMYSMHSFVDFDQFPALALSAGKPLIVQEWGIKNDEGGAAEFLQYMREQFEEHGGSGPGKLEMENYFNLGEYQISSGTTSPQAAQRYRDLW